MFPGPSARQIRFFIAGSGTDSASLVWFTEEHNARTNSRQVGGREWYDCNSMTPAGKTV
jgi:hypothetical protein